MFNKWSVQVEMERGQLYGFVNVSNKYWDRKNTEFLNQLVNYERLKVRFNTSQLAS
jgi:hypothetical protein